MPRKDRNTRRRDIVLALMRKGELLCCGENGAEGVVWWLEPSNRTVGPVTAGKVIALPDVEAGGDGLLSGMCQTYRYRSVK